MKNVLPRITDEGNPQCDIQICELFLVIVILLHVLQSSSKKVLNLGTGNYKNSEINISPPLSTNSRAK